MPIECHSALTSWPANGDAIRAPSPYFLKIHLIAMPRDPASANRFISLALPLFLPGTNAGCVTRGVDEQRPVTSIFEV
jgi:hypothetical protein